MYRQIYAVVTAVINHNIIFIICLNFEGVTGSCLVLLLADMAIQIFHKRVNKQTISYINTI